MVKGQKYHILYKTTCTITGNFYVGVHSTENLEDGYLGSGKRLGNSIRKHGKENHTREILEFHETREELLKREREVVNGELLENENCMNLKEGGEGGFASEEHKQKWITNGSLAANEALRQKWKDCSYKEKRVEKWRNSFSDESLLAMLKPLEKNRGALHTEESKKKIGIANSVSQKGEKNSQFGKIWMHNSVSVIKVPREKEKEYVIMGWKRGRKIVKTQRGKTSDENVTE